MVRTEIGLRTEKGLVSVIIPTYNGSSFISETIQSAIEQTYTNLEVIIVNDGSVDNTKDIVESFIKKDTRIKLIDQVNSGVSIARNNGIESSRGEYIAFLDHDDLWLPDKLSKQIQLFNGNTILVYSNAITYDITRNIKYPMHNSKIFRSGKITESLCRNNFIPCMTAVIKKEAMFSLEYIFDKNMQMAEEYDLFLRLSMVGDFNFTPDVTAVYRIHDRNDAMMRNYLIVHDISYMLKKYNDLFDKKCKKNFSKWYLIWVAEDLKRAGLKMLPAILLIFSLELRKLCYTLISNSQLDRIRALKAFFKRD